MPCSSGLYTIVLGCFCEFTASSNLDKILILLVRQSFRVRSLRATNSRCLLIEEVVIMKNTNHVNDTNLPSTERSPLMIACEQTGTQRVQMKMDELFNSSPRLPIINEPALYASNETLRLKPVKANVAKSNKRRISTNSAAGRSKRLELERSQKVTAVRSKRVNAFSSQTMKLAFLAVLAFLFRT